MKTTQKIIVLLLCFIIKIIAQEPEPNVAVNTNRSGALIYVNNLLVGEGSVLLTLELGRYEIKVKENGLPWDAQYFTQIVDVTDINISQEIEIQFSDKLILDSSPQNSYVFMGDSLIGSTPLILSPTVGEFTFRKKNYGSKKLQLENHPFEIPIKLDFVGEQNPDSFIGTPLFWTLIGSAVALGTTSAYLKIEADKKYEEYLDTKDKSMLDQTNRLDTISGISLGVLQINIGALLYFFLSEN